MKVNKKSSLFTFLLYSIFSSFVLTRGVFLVYLASKGLSVLEVSAYQAIYSLSTTLLEIPTGFVGDKFGKKKSLLLGNILLSLQAFFMIINNNHIFFMILATMEALAYSFISGSDSALLYEIIKTDNNEEKYLKVNSRLLSIKSITTGLALLVGSIIAKYSWTILYLLAVLIIIISSIILVFVQEPHVEKAITAEKGDKFSLHSLKNTIKKNIIYPKEMLFIIFLIATSLIDGFFMCYYNFNQIILETLNVNIEIIGLFFSALYFINSVAYLLADFLNKHINKKNLFIGILFIESMLFISLAYANSTMVIMLISILISFFPEVLFIIADSIIQNNIISDYRATILSIVSLIRSLMTSVVYIVLGAIFNLINIRNIFMFIGIGICICTITVLLIMNRSKKINVQTN